MGRFSTSTILFLTVLHVLFLDAHSTTYWQDIEVLKQLKNSVYPNSMTPGSCLISWDFSVDPCDNLSGEKFTCGLRCDVVISNVSRVTELALDQANYSGTLTSVSWNLPYLQSLDLTNNVFTGSVPESLSNLTRVQRLGLSGNSLSGSIPSSLGSLSNLEELYLDNNFLEGAIPLSFNGLKSLKRLELQNNKLNGEFPELGQLNNLTFIDASDNSISGQLPASFPASLIEIVMRNNSIEGNIPVSLTGLDYLQVIDLSYNKLSGWVPASLFTHTSLEQVTLSGNQFGSVQEPGSSFQNSQLIALDLSNNEIHGLLPGFLGLMPRLSSLSLENNKLSGMIPTQYALKMVFPDQGVSQFERLLLGGNYLFGPIPGPLLDLKPGSVTVRLGDNCLYRCPLRLFLCEGGEQKSLSECQAFGPIIP
ncbi:brassinosteroid LRR receptor kinase BRL2 [Lycium barbarum]|uniref:brassinosteroid LRR receptor kinase BRL2 n=1 Tax=Lycium barbarum TaxID=112863 RepID=UPI00293F3BA2|nr:brassinosteroid LRR receptor kinase BRL2 [Lycium barbarum]